MIVGQIIYAVIGAIVAVRVTAGLMRTFHEPDSADKAFLAVLGLLAGAFWPLAVVVWLLITLAETYNRRRT